MFSIPYLWSIFFEPATITLHISTYASMQNIAGMFQPLLKADMLKKISLTCFLESSTSTFTTLLSSISWEIKSTNMPPHSSSRICRIRELFGGSLSLKTDRMAVSIAFWVSSGFVPGTNDTGRVCCPNKTSTVIKQPAISV